MRDLASLMPSEARCRWGFWHRGVTSLGNPECGSRPPLLWVPSASRGGVSAWVEHRAAWQHTGAAGRLAFSLPLWCGPLRLLQALWR